MNRSAAVEYFYTTRKWRNCRAAFLDSKGYLCEDCLKEGIINPGSKEQPLEVHHKEELTEDNINDPNITLNWDNMEALCKQHHDKKKKSRKRRWTVDSNGTITI